LLFRLASVLASGQVLGDEHGVCLATHADCGMQKADLVETSGAQSGLLSQLVAR